MVKLTVLPLTKGASAEAISLKRLAGYCGIALLMQGITAHGQEVADSKPFELCAAEKVTYDSNLYRLPDNADVAGRLGPAASRDDYLYSTTLCANGNWHLSRQDVKLKADVSDNRFQRNEVLNNASANAALDWSWQSVGNWSGKFGGAYSRSLGTFYNDRPITKDVVETYQYSAELSHPIIGRLNAAVGAQGRFAQHDAADRKADNYRNNDGRVSLEYVSRATNVLAVDYHFAKARYPTTVFFEDAPLARDYDEQVTNLRLRYGSPITTLNATAGYIQRRYQEDPTRDYSGGIGRVSLQWQPLGGLQLVVSGWRELTSYFDAESDYFVSRGVSLAPVWSPRANFKIGPLLWWEKQQYLSNDLAASTSATTLEQREDKVVALGAQLTYSFLRHLELNAAYRHEQHDSNRVMTGYHDNLSSIKLLAKF